MCYLLTHRTVKSVNHSLTEMCHSLIYGTASATNRNVSLTHSLTKVCHSPTRICHSLTLGYLPLIREICYSLTHGYLPPTYENTSHIYSRHLTLTHSLTHSLTHPQKSVIDGNLSLIHSRICFTYANMSLARSRIGLPDIQLQKYVAHSLTEI